MPPPSTPSYVFVVRHGARLDMANSQWQLTSPTPYDPPLTYGGWTQSRSVGLRIASLLQNQITPPAVSKDGEKKKKKKLRVVIHSSPFLRCIQTSVSIASGLAQSHHQTVMNAHYVDEQGNITSEPTVPLDVENVRFSKPLLRLDAWLGEWLSADYFVDITPPPPTVLFVGTAKADYLRPSAAGAALLTTPVSSASMQTSPLFSINSLESALPTATTGGFLPPTPNCVVSSNNAIPRGYFSHAKECVELDLGWDSLKLGDGGEYGEEWPTMHKRFRSGWKKLMWYYAGEDPRVSTVATRWKRPGTGSVGEVVKKDGTASSSRAAPPFTGNPTPPLSDNEASNDEDGGKHPPVQPETTDEDEEIETILILVTHGAGCNALIGAITHQPVLIDIGIASLTMGVRRDIDPAPPPLPPHPNPNNSPSDLPEPPSRYDLKLIADREHLRNTVSPTGTPPISPNLVSLNRGRYGTGSSLGAFTLSGSGLSGSSLTSALAGSGSSIKRSVSTNAASSPRGLWSRPVSRDSRPASRDSSVLRFGSSSSVTSREDENEKNKALVEDEAEGEAEGLGGGLVSGTGLWGTPIAPRQGLWGSPPGEKKRRWTVSRSGF